VDAKDLELLSTPSSEKKKETEPKKYSFLIDDTATDTAGVIIEDDVQETVIPETPVKEVVLDNEETVEEMIGALVDDAEEEVDDSEEVSEAEDEAVIDEPVAAFTAEPVVEPVVETPVVEPVVETPAVEIPSVDFIEKPMVEPEIEPIAEPAVEKPVEEPKQPTSFIVDDTVGKEPPKKKTMEERLASVMSDNKKEEKADETVPTGSAGAFAPSSAGKSFLVDDTAPSVSKSDKEKNKGGLFKSNKKKEEKKEDENSYMVRSFVSEAEKQDSVDKEKFQRTEQQPKTKGRKKLRTYQQRQNILGYVFMTPWIIGFLAFTLFPFVATIFLSFTHVKHTVKGYQFKVVGLSNYITAFTGSEKFTPNLVLYLRRIVPYTFIVVVLSFIIAFLLNKISKGKGVLRTVYFLPVIIMSGPVMAQINSVNENASKVAEMAGRSVESTYSNLFIMKIIDSYSPALASGLGDVFDQLSLILWFTGIPIVLFINALQKINVSIYEAAQIDSANSWQIMWKITIPMVKSIGLICTVFTIIQLGMYDTINPVYQLIVKATGDTSGGLGYAATYAWIYSLIVLLLIGFVFLIFRDKKVKGGA
jgi:ABC-type sugar transport system permease subunit